MKLVCPNKNDSRWIALVDKVGEFEAYRQFIANNYTIPESFQESTVENWLKYLVDSKLIHRFDDKWFVNKGRWGEDNENIESKSAFQKRIDKLNNINTYYRDIAGNQDIILITKTKNSATIEINPLAAQAIFNARQQGKSFQLFSDNLEKPNEKLDNLLTGWLSSKGISVEAINELKTRTGEDAVAMADIARKTIYIVDNKANIETLPEESSHFLFAMVKNTPMYDRYLNLARKSTLYNTVKEQYKDIYDTEEKMAFETAGKLLTSALVNNNVYSENKSLFDQLLATAKLIWAKIKGIFGKNSANEIDAIINAQYERLANDMLSDTLEQVYNSDIDSDEAYFQVKLDPFKDVLKRATDSLKRKLAHYKQKNIRDEYKAELDRIYEQLEKNQDVEGFIGFIDQADKDINIQHNRMLKLEEVPSLVTTKDLRDLYVYIKAYDVLDVFISQRFSDPRLSSLKERILPMISKKNEIKTFYLEQGKVKVSEFLYEYAKSNSEMTSEKIQDLLEHSDTDINIVSAYLSTIGDSKDAILALSSKAIRESKDTARLVAYNAEKRVLKLLEDYEKETGEKGLSVYNDMFEKNVDGKLTGNMVSQLDSQFFRDRTAYREELAKIYEDEELLAEQVKKWTKAHKNDAKYKTQYEKLESNPKKFKLFTELNKIYTEAKDFLPPNYEMYSKMPQIRKKSLERAISSKDIKSGLKTIKEGLKDQILLREDVDEFGIVDDAGKAISTVPIYYTRYLEDTNDINTDFSSTLIRFYNMAANYKYMSDIVAELETIKDILAERNVTQKRFGVAKIDSTTGDIITKKGIESSGYRMFEEYMNMQVYGRMRSENEVIDVAGVKIDLGKVADKFNKWTALNGLALNLFSGFSNITLGNILRFGDSLAGTFYGKKDYLRANGIYTANIASYCNDIGSRNKKSKLALWSEYFDVLQNNNERVREIRAFRGNKFTRLLGLNTLMFANNAGEHYLQTTLALAMAQNFKLDSGKTVNMWETTEVKEGRLIFKDKDITRKDIARFIDTVKGANQYMDGVYSDIDRSIAQKYALGRIALLFRKFIVPGFERRFRSKRFNYRLNEEQEGTYISTWNFAIQLAKDLISFQPNVVSQWNSMSKMERANVIRTLNEIAFMVGVALLARLASDWEDKDDDYKKFLLYQFHRTYSEIAFFVPGPNASEMFKILKSPAAGVMTAQNLTTFLIMAGQPLNWGDTYERGKRAGELKIAVKFVDLIPVINKIEDLQDIDRQIDYIK